MNSGELGAHSNGIKRAIALLVLLAVALAGLLSLAWVFRVSIADIVYSQRVAQLDTAVFQQLHATATAFELRMFVFLTAFGSPVAMTILAIVGAFWLTLRKNPVIVAAWVAALAGSSGLALGIKHIFARQRPPGALEYLTGGSYSFPSTHALCSLVGYGMLAYVLSQYFCRTLRSQMTVIVAAVVMVATIAMSRLVLGVHYFSDVSAALMAGSTWLALCICALRMGERRRGASSVTATPL